MEAPHSSSPSHQYPQAIQLKLYQAFIFSIPILFSIILFLLFYLFYLKRRASNFSAAPPILPRTIHDSTPHVTTSFDSDLKAELKNQLSTVLFDEYLKARDSLEIVFEPSLMSKEATTLQFCESEEVCANCSSPDFHGIEP
ncbi:unnamed protein product [Fraxinus pennsylvanica]|uniref:Uncharacterized protein n=1 Tax=Fraxinus pennsylvanica TaxID=56036 RepID=A0AAD1ZJW4_9LAMI|nr:unnamed protein product [Fraxinus pennsylvanica]